MVLTVKRSRTRRPVGSSRRLRDASVASNNPRRNPGLGASSSTGPVRPVVGHPTCLPSFFHSRPTMAQKLASKQSQAISLKGSTKIVCEFFDFSVVRPPFPLHLPSPLPLLNRSSACCRTQRANIQRAPNCSTHRTTFFTSGASTRPRTSRWSRSKALINLLVAHPSERPGPRSWAASPCFYRLDLKG